MRKFLIVLFVLVGVLALLLVSQPSARAPSAGVQNQPTPVALTPPGDDDYYYWSQDQLPALAPTD